MTSAVRICIKLVLGTPVCYDGWCASNTSEQEQTTSAKRYTFPSKLCTRYLVYDYPLYRRASEFLRLFRTMSGFLTRMRVIDELRNLQSTGRLLIQTVYFELKQYDRPSAIRMMDDGRASKLLLHCCGTYR